MDEEKILKALEMQQSRWVSQSYFVDGLKIAQYPGIIQSLKEKGYNIEVYKESGRHAPKYYRLLPKETLF